MCNMICEHCSWCDKLSKFGIKFYEDDFPLALDHTNSSLSINKRCVDHYAWLNKCRSGDTMSWSMRKTYKIAKFMGSTWGPPGSCRPQMGPMLAPWVLLSGIQEDHFGTRTHWSLMMSWYGIFSSLLVFNQRESTSWLTKFWFKWTMIS